MICLHCGYCCTKLWIIVVRDPDLADREGLTQENVLEVGGLDKTPCPHLLGPADDGKYACLIHDRSWYSETPCAKHEQIGRSDQLCRMGKHLLIIGGRAE